LNGGGITTVAVLGAGGTMGKGMARNLAAGAGIAVRAWNRSPGKLDDLSREDDVVVCDRAEEAVAGADVVLTMLSDGEAVLATMAGAAPAAAPEAIWLQQSTIGIEATERCAELAARHGLDLVDAPVLGTRQPAEAGELVVLASGPEPLRVRLEPLFAVIGKRTLWVGEAGAGSRLKVAVNAWIVSVVEGAAETLALAEGVGVEPRLVLEAIAGGPLDLPYLEVKAKAMLERDFTPSFRLALAAKDAGLAADAAASAGLELPMLRAIHGRLTAAAAQHGDDDLAATYLLSVRDSAEVGTGR
jgi:3-hydroxyisobutyrate dehydrogenase